MKREGMLFLYRTQWGVRLIEKISDKYQKQLKLLKYVVIFVGFCLMGIMIYLFGYSLWQYIINSQITRAIKAPPIAPLIPYFPKLFGMESFFPQLYFIYFIIIISLVAFVHEFFHGIFMKLFKIRIKSTGIVFLGPILGAFVEQDDKQMIKKKNSEQMCILASGVFANLILCISCFIIMIGFFYFAYAPSGYIFNTYSMGTINKTDISGFGLTSNENLTEVFSKNRTFYLDEELKLQLDETFEGKNLSYLVVYDGPAITSGLKGAITEINREKIRSREDLQNFMATTTPGEKVFIKTKDNEEIRNFEFILGTNPNDNSIGYLGIGSYTIPKKGILSGVIRTITKFKEPNILYEPKSFPKLANFIYDFFWWIVMINLLVALFNMLPLGILDGGRFFYLAVLSLTKSKNISKWSFKLVTWVILFFFALMMFLWFIRMF